MSDGRYIVAAAFLSTGAALLVYIFSGVSLLATLLAVLLLSSGLGVWVWQRSTPDRRDQLRASIKAGVIAGFWATLAYDVFRFLLIKVTGIPFWPFDIFQIFGKSVIGFSAVGPGVTFVGVLYHLANGIGFAIAYTVAFGRKGVWAGLGWAMALETLMVSVYPGWLGLKALDEFLSVSIFGHVVYGVTLGYLAKRLLASRTVTMGG